MPTATRAQAIAKIKSGEVLAAVIIPRDLTAQLSSDVTQAKVGTALQRQRDRAVARPSQLNSALAQANLGFSEQIQRAAAQAIGLLLRGGNLGVLGAPREHGWAGARSRRSLHSIIARRPPGPDRAELEQIANFAIFAAQNLA